MKKLDFHTFHSEAFNTYPLYKADNSWFHFEMEPDAHGLFSCWTAYQKTDAPSAEMLLLGDTKIRTDNDLVLNFGLSSANGVQEEETRREIQELQNRRNQIAAGRPGSAASSASAPARAGAPSLTPIPTAGSASVSPSASMAPGATTSALPAGGAVSVIGAGSILSTKGWSPMLNDSFIMGGVHAEHDFHLALSPDEKAIFEGVNSAIAAKDIWKEFFRRNPVSFWNSQYNVPRVFTRELLGLAAFGYKPEFSKHQLTFVCTNKGEADEASLSKYCESLRNAKLTPIADKTKVLKEIARFVFDDEKALD